MCGICGIFNYARKEPVDAKRLSAMTESMVHRGPDDRGDYIDNYIGLGFRRLSIIDLSGGHQPMHSCNGLVTIVFNGEIYNFPQLRQLLENKGHRFRTRSDTEVIIHGYEQWGRDVLDRLNGMFGLAIWDARKQDLIIARDAMGVKPVYYRIFDGQLLFGSEIRAIKAGMKGKPVVSATAIYEFLRYRYTPSPETIYEGINKLAPGTGVTVSSDGTIEKFRWYTFKPHPFEPMPKPQDAAEQLLDKYRGATKRQLLSDVEVGLLLSGGVDSALLLSLISNQGAPRRTYTVGYEGTVDDEMAEARETANIFGAKHTQVTLTLKDFEQSLECAVSYLEEPILSSSIVPMYHVCQAAGREIKVVLSGQGPDELFGGYKRHVGVHLGKIWRKLPSPIRLVLSYGMQALPRAEALKRAEYSLNTRERLSRYRDIFSIMSQRQILSILKPGLLKNEYVQTLPPLWLDLGKYIEHTDELSGFQYLEIRSSLPDELLLYGDKMSMCHSLEARVPFLDREVVEYAERLSSNYKVRGVQTKWLHKKVCSRFLPREIIRRPKRGFAVNTVDEWFRGALSKKMEGIILDPLSEIFNFLEQKSVVDYYQNHVDGKSDNHKILYGVVALETFLRTHENR